MAERMTGSNQSLEKGLRIIEFMAEHKKPVRLQDISKALNFAPSTMLRFLTSLENMKYVKQDPDTLRYALTLKISKIGSMVSSSNRIRDIVHPYLVELSDLVQEYSCLAIEENNRVVYVDVVSGPANTLRVMQRIGKEAPLHCTGVGKLLLLNYDADKLNRITEQLGMEKLTYNTIETLPALRNELDKVRKQNFAVDDEECEIGARCVAAAIRDYTGQVIAAISVSGPVARMTMQKIEDVKQHVKNTAQEISEALGYEGVEHLKITNEAL